MTQEMTQDGLRQILREAFGDAAGAPEIVAETDRGPVWALAVRGVTDLPLGVWEQAREALAEHELWPVLTESEERMRFFAEAYDVNADFRKGHDSRAVLAEGLALDLDEWLRGCDEQEAQVRAEQEAENEAFWASPEGRAALRAAREPDNFNEDLVAADLEDESQVLVAPTPRAPQTMWMMLVPASEGWEVPATLCFGGWNACLEPRVHVAMIRHWHHTYGAQLIGLTHDTLTFSVARPPRSHEEALPLAREQRHFCSEGAEEYTLEQMADELVGQDFWGFWWD